MVDARRNWGFSRFFFIFFFLFPTNSCECCGMCLVQSCPAGVPTVYHTSSLPPLFANLTPSPFQRLPPNFDLCNGSCIATRPRSRRVQAPTPRFPLPIFRLRIQPGASQLLGTSSMLPPKKPRSQRTSRRSKHTQPLHTRQQSPTAWSGE